MGTVHHGNVVALEPLEVTVADLGEVHGLQPRRKEPVALEARRGSFAVRFHGVLDFGGRFLQMDLHRQIQLLGQGRDANHVFRREGVGGVGAKGNLDLLAVPVFVPQGQGFPQPFLRAACPGRGELDEGAAQLGAKAGLKGHGGGHLREEVHVAKGGSAAPKHLGGGEGRTIGDKFRIHKAPF